MKGVEDLVADMRFLAGAAHEREAHLISDLLICKLKGCVLTGI